MYNNNKLRRRMKKLLILGTAVLTTALLINGLFYPESPLMWLASHSVAYSIVRAALLVILVALLLSNPPRAMLFRLFLAACAASLGIATIALLMTFEMNIIDAIVFMEIGIIFAIEALESPERYGYAVKLRRNRTAT
jgi:hypothetical protein